MSEFTFHANLFVHADGTLAEYLCGAEPLGTTAQRAAQLHELHAGHPETCRVRQVAALHIP